MIISLSKLLLLPVAVVAMNARLSSSAGALWFITVTCLSVLALLAGHLFAFNYRVEPADVNYAEELYWYQSFMLFNLIEVIGLSIPVVIIQYFYRRERSS
ncbi:hypothetical protein ACFO9Q_13490 [Paenibacillus sp. GCM10023252]|uniref:hypothetical protein n=1 Tax=Paenibacillus sp. GCM10023252 TaxID=3252649 RepID=UPI0036103D70